MTEKKNTIGRFEIIEKIGEGPIGAVYKALDPIIRRTVAIKVIKLYALEETATFADVFEKIYRVVRTSTSLNHPNICIIYDLSEEKKIPYITMEFVEGNDLDTLLQKKHQFKRGELLNILQQTCDALDFAHRKNVVHQDLKSTNILVTPDLHIKITDFGIAGLDEIAAAQTKKLLSIPYYISPEQTLGERVSPASDLFSLGVVMYQLLSGQLPFPGTSAANVLMMIARDNPSQPKDLQKSGISKEDWDSFFSIALAKSPNQRFRSAKEMFEAISAIIPMEDTAYYPYGFIQHSVDLTGELERTNAGENDSPTVMIDASRMVQEMENAAQSGGTGSNGPDHSSVGPSTAEMPVPSPPEPATLLIDKEQFETEQAAQTIARSSQTPAAPPTELIKIPHSISERKMPVMDSTGAAATQYESSRETMMTPPPMSPAIPVSVPAPPTVLTQMPQPVQPDMHQPVAEPPPPPPVAQPIAAKTGPPNLRRYLLGAIALAFMIALVGGGLIWLFYERTPTPDSSQNKQEEKPSGGEQTGSGQATINQQEEVVTPVVGEIQVSSDPSGATVFLGEEEKGVTPLTIGDLQPGKYSLMVQLKGYQDVQQEVEISQELPSTSIPLTLEKVEPTVGTLVIDSNPQGASIIIGKRVIGFTPKSLPKTNAGKYTVTLRKEGYEEFTDVARVKKDETVTLFASMVEIPKPAPPPPPEPVKPKLPDVKPGELVTMGPGVTPPKSIKKSAVNLPPAARGMDGVVGLDILITETGKVTDVRITKSANSVLDDAAMKAVKNWVYEPAKKYGVPVKIRIPVTMTFRSSR